MTNPLTVAELVEALRRHQILTPAQLDEVVRQQAKFARAEDLTKDLVGRGWLTEFQAETLLQGRAADLDLGSYLLLEPRGEGGMGRVFRAYHRLMKRPVAVKIIRRDILSHPGILDRFKREIQAVGKFSHPNIVVAHDACQVRDTLCLVMEYVEGIDLERLVKARGRLPVSEACAYIRQAAHGLQHVHEHGMVHRDIKPSNLILTVAGNKQTLIKILDLGLVLALAEGSWPGGDDLTVSHTPLGTPAYAAPEQVLDPHDVDIRADIFSLGCTLYFLLTGEVAYPRKTDVGNWRRHLETNPQPLRELCPEAPRDLADFVHKMIAKDPKDRPATPAKVVAALAPHSQGETSLDQPLPSEQRPLPSPTPTAPFHQPGGSTDHSAQLPGPASGPTSVLPPSAPAAPRTPERPRLLWLVAVTGILVLLVIAGATAWHLSQTPSVVPPVIPPKVTTGDMVKKTSPAVEKPTVGKLLTFKQHKGWVGALAFFPDGSQIVSGGATEVLRWETKTGKVIPFLEGKMTGVKTLAVDPHGLCVLTGGQNQGEFFGVWDVATKQRKNALSEHIQQVQHVAIAADGKHALSFGHDMAAWLWELPAGKPSRRFDAVGSIPLAIAFLPGHAHFLTASRKTDGANSNTLWVQKWSVAAGVPAQELVSLALPTIACAALTPDGTGILVGHPNGNLQLRAVPGGKIVRTFSGHTGMVHGLAISADGKRALSGGGYLDGLEPVDCSVRLWDVDTGVQLHQFTGHTRPVWGVAFAPNGLRAASASEDKTVSIWGLP